jgi:hypothetical protein
VCASMRDVKPNIFISCSELFRRGLAGRFKRAIESAGMNALIVSESPRPDADWGPETKVEAYLAHADALVVLVTPDAQLTTGEYVPRLNIPDEIGRARRMRRLRRRIVVVRAPGVQMPSNINPTYITLDMRHPQRAIVECLSQLAAWGLPGSANATSISGAPKQSSKVLRIHQVRSEWKDHLDALTAFISDNLGSGDGGDVAGLIPIGLSSRQDLSRQTLPTAYRRRRLWAPRPKHLPARLTSIDDAFARHGPRLLVVGEPGSGKTTALLAYAQLLVSRLSRDEDVPIPLYIPLSEWRSEELDPTRWIAEVVHVPVDRLKEARDSNRIILLLDGLDDLSIKVGETGDGDQRRPQERFYQLLHDMHDTPWVITCRASDYEVLAKGGHQLPRSTAAFQLLPLPNAAIFAHLSPWPGLLQAARRDSNLRRLLRTPLVLRMFAWAYSAEKSTSTALSLGSPGTINAIVQRYVAQRFAAELQRLSSADRQPPATLDELTRGLGRLAMAGFGRESSGTYDPADLRRAFGGVWTLTLPQFLQDVGLLKPFRLGSLTGPSLRFAHAMVRDYFALPAAQEALREDDIPQAVAACMVLGLIRGTRSAEALIPCASSPHDEVRAEALVALARCAPDIALPHLVAGLDSRSNRVAMSALLGLMILGTNPAMRLLEHAIIHPAGDDGTFRALAAAGMVSLLTPRSIESPVVEGRKASPVIIHAVEAGSIAAVAILAVNPVGDSELTRPLETCARSEDPELRRLALQALLPLAPHVDTNALIAPLFDADERTQLAAAQLIAAARPRAQSTVRLLLDKVPTGRDAAGALLGLRAIGPAAIRPLISIAERRTEAAAMAIALLVTLTWPMVEPTEEFAGQIAESFVRRASLRKYTNGLVLGPQAIPTLARILSNGKAIEQRAARQMLVSLGKEHKRELLDRAQQLGPAERRALAPVLAELKVVRLRHAHPTKPPEVQPALAAVRQPLVDVLITKLGNPTIETNIAQRAVMDLVRFGEAGLVRVISSVQQDTASVYLIGYLGIIAVVDPARRPTIERAAAHWPERIRATFAQVVRRHVGEDAELEAVEWFRRYYVAGVREDLHRIFLQEAKEYLTSEDAAVRRYALDLLIGIGGEAEGPILSVLDELDSETSVLALASLADFGSTHASRLIRQVGRRRPELRAITNWAARSVAMRETPRSRRLDSRESGDEA